MFDTVQYTNNLVIELSYIDTQLIIKNILYIIELHTEYINF